MFDGRNIRPGFPEELTIVVSFLNEKAAAGEFEFCDSMTYWEKNERIIRPLGMGHEGGGYYFAVALPLLLLKKTEILFFQKKKIFGGGLGRYTL